MSELKVATVAGGASAPLFVLRPRNVAVVLQAGEESQRHCRDLDSLIAHILRCGLARLVDGLQNSLLEFTDFPLKHSEGMKRISRPCRKLDTGAVKFLEDTRQTGGWIIRHGVVDFRKLAQNKSCVNNNNDY